MPEVLFKFSARPDNIKIARLVAMGFANRKGLSYEEISDIALLIGEACSYILMHVKEGTELRLSFNSTDDILFADVTGSSTLYNHGLKPSLGRLSFLIIKQMADTFILSKNPPSIRIKYRMKKNGLPNIIDKLEQMSFNFSDLAELREQ
ncbi:MAG: hypothetical protein M1269_03095 [Chloroflexi bacterium]|nr:hypothetical protein [Chloroflexota bacterium]